MGQCPCAWRGSYAAEAGIWLLLCSVAVVQNPVDSASQTTDVLRVDGREHTDAQLVAAQLAVRLDVEDAVGAQNLGDLCGVDVVLEVDGADDQRALCSIGDGVASARFSAQL